MRANAPECLIVTSQTATSASSLTRIASYPPGATFGPRRLHDFEFVWMLRGGGVWRSDQLDRPGRDRPVAEPQDQAIGPGQLVLARKGATDSYAWSPNRTSSHAFVHFEAPDLSPYPALEDWPSVRDMPHGGVLSGLCGYLIDLAGGVPGESASRTDDIVRLLLDLFIRGPFPVDITSSWNPRLGPLLDAVRGEWREGGMRIIENSMLADWAGVSIGYLARMFKENIGAPPAALLETARLVRAATVLERSNSSMAEVASWTGFADPYHLSHRFAKLYGMPPGRYRNAPLKPTPLGPIASDRAAAAVMRLNMTD
jgi:AraC-like DNA-binding protein